MFFLVLMIWIRASWPRFRYDQLMSFGWKVSAAHRSPEFHHNGRIYCALRGGLFSIHPQRFIQAETSTEIPHNGEIL